MLRPPEPAGPPRRRALAAVGAVALLAGVGGAVLATRRAPGEASPPVADELLARAFDDADGAPRRLADWNGRVRVVNFWATWCPPCVDEMPDLQRVHDAYANRGVTVIGVGIDGGDRIRAFRDRLKLGFPLLVAGVGGSDLGRALGNDTGVLPYTVVLSAQGRIVQRRVGALDAALLRRWLDDAAGTT
jgi:thiol-disulfide isomerase/thioredoxin